tara:strand:+ start:1337 stop:1570 length:234 start_codon:yes stop_codon:yes gene_type:complete
MSEINGGPTGREWGTITAEVEKLSHDLRNMKMVVNAMSDEIDALENSLSTLQAKIYTTIAVCTALASIAAFATKALQ